MESPAKAEPSAEFTEVISGKTATRIQRTKTAPITWDAEAAVDILITEAVDVVAAEAADTKAEASTMEAAATITKPLISIISNNINRIRVLRTALYPLKTITPHMKAILITAPHLEDGSGNHVNNQRGMALWSILQK